MPEKTKSSGASKRTFLALTDLTYGPTNKTVEAGKTVSDLPASSVKWLLEQGHIASTEEV